MELTGEQVAEAGVGPRAGCVGCGGDAGAKATKPHRTKEIRVLLDNLSTHTTPEVMAWLDR
jgi:hypothetical protein